MKNVFEYLTILHPVWKFASNSVEAIWSIIGKNMTIMPIENLIELLIFISYNKLCYAVLYDTGLSHWCCHVHEFNKWVLFPRSDIVR